MLCGNPCAHHTKNILNLKSGPKPWCFNGFVFRTALAPQRGANFGGIFGSRPSAARFLGADFPSRRGVKGSSARANPDHIYTQSTFQHFHHFGSSAPADLDHMSRKLAMLAGVPLALARNMPGAGFAHSLILSDLTPPPGGL